MIRTGVAIHDDDDGDDDAMAVLQKIRMVEYANE